TEAILRDGVLPSVDVLTRRFRHLCFRLRAHDDFGWCVGMRSYRRLRGLRELLHRRRRSLTHRQDLRARGRHLVRSRDAMEIGAEADRLRRRAQLCLRDVQQADQERPDETEIREKRHENSDVTQRLCMYAVPWFNPLRRWPDALFCR